MTFQASSILVFILPYYLHPLHSLHQYFPFNRVVLKRNCLASFSSPCLSAVGSHSELRNASSTFPRAAITSGCLDRREVLVLFIMGTHSLFASLLAVTNLLYLLLVSTPLSSCWKHFLTSSVYLFWRTGSLEKAFQSYRILGLGLGWGWGGLSCRSHGTWCWLPVAHAP